VLWKIVISSGNRQRFIHSRHNRKRGRMGKMEGKLTVYEGKPIDEMSRRELIQALVDITRLYHTSLENIRVQVELENCDWNKRHQCIIIG